MTAPRCDHVMVATDVVHEVDGVRAEWPRLEAHCTLEPGHIGQHVYGGEWIDPTTGKPVRHPSDV